MCYKSLVSSFYPNNILVWWMCAKGTLGGRMFCWPTVTTAGANANLTSNKVFREYTRRAAVTTKINGERNVKRNILIFSRALFSIFFYTVMVPRTGDSHARIKILKLTDYIRNQEYNKKLGVM